MKKTFIATLALGALFTGSSYAAMTIEQTKTFSFTPANSAVLTFDKFDTMGGTRTLLGVNVTTYLTKVGGSLFVDNDSGVAGSGQINQSVTIVLTGRVLLNASNQELSSKTVSAVSAYIATVGVDNGDGAGVQPDAPNLDYDGTVFENTSNYAIDDVGSNYFFDYQQATPGTYDITATGSQSIDVRRRK